MKTTPMRNAECGTRNRRVQKLVLVLVLVLMLAPASWADNVVVVNPASSPARVQGTVTTIPSGSPVPIKATTPIPITATTPIPITATTPIPITATTPIPVINAVKQYTGVPSSMAILTADGTVFTLAAGERGFIQNLSADAPLAVKYGASASTSSFNFILPPDSAQSTGKGGVYIIDSWVGVVSVAKMTGTASYVAWKQAP